jgi:hypothetical protein
MFSFDALICSEDDEFNDMLAEWPLTEFQTYLARDARQKGKSQVSQLLTQFQ